MELATARKEAAAAAAQLKHGLANWQVCWGGRPWHASSCLACLGDGGSKCRACLGMPPAWACRLPGHAACLPAILPPALPCPQSELDMHKGEANRLKREMERVEGERERVREEARK